MNGPIHGAKSGKRLLDGSGRTVTPSKSRHRLIVQLPVFLRMRRGDKAHIELQPGHDVKLLVEYLDGSVREMVTRRVIYNGTVINMVFNKIDLGLCIVSEILKDGIRVESIES